MKKRALIFLLFLGCWFGSDPSVAAQALHTSHASRLVHSRHSYSQHLRVDSVHVIIPVLVAMAEPVSPVGTEPSAEVAVWSHPNNYALSRSSHQGSYSEGKPAINSRPVKLSEGFAAGTRAYLFKRFISADTTESRLQDLKKPAYLVSPFVSYAPETELQIGAITLYSFYLHDDSITRVSAQSGSFNYTLLHQYKFEMDPDFWTTGNKMHFTGTFIYQSIPLNYYGIGYSTVASNQEILASKQIFLDAEAEREVLRDFRIGLTFVYTLYNFDTGNYEYFLANDQNLYAPMGAKSLFSGISLIYDSRNYLNSTTRGAFLRFNTAYAPQFASTLNPLVSANLQASYFLSLSAQNVVGLNMLAGGMYGVRVPFYLLPQLGGSSILRGYYSGRYRDKNALQVQAEYRLRLIPRIELAAFGGAGTVFGYEAYSSSEIKPNYGGGVRYFFDLSSRLSLRLDYGVGEKPPGENRIRGVYVQFGEAF